LILHNEPLFAFDILNDGVADFNIVSLTVHNYIPLRFTCQTIILRITELQEAGKDKMHGKF
jgi:hypothetical protein